MLGLLWDLHQQSRIADAHHKAARADSSIGDLRAAMREMEDRLDRLSLMSAAMWSLLQQNSGMTDDEPLSKIEAIDLSDGRLDGKVRRTVKTCLKCHRPMSSRHQRCIYCGDRSAPETASDAVL
jgi:hypothetical protein